MASPSPCRWPWSPASTNSSIHISNFPSNSSIFFSFRLKRRRFAAFSLRDSSSSSSSSSASPTDSKKKSVNPRVSSSQPGLIADYAENDVVLAPSSSRSSSAKKKPLSFEYLFGKQYLWRRILFASKKVRSIILLNVITLIYASNIPVIKEVEAIMDPSTFTVVRFMVSAIPFIPFVVQARDDVCTRNAGIELGLWVSLGYLTQALGLLTSDAGRTSFLSMFTVIVVPLLDGMLGAVVPAVTWFGAIMSIIGVAMLESSGSPPCAGDFLNFLSAVFFGVHMLRTEHISRSTSKENFLPLLGYEVCVVALLSTLWYFVGGWLEGSWEFNPSSWSWAIFWDWMVTFPWIPALYTGIFSTGLCLWVEMAAMRDVSATETAIIYGLEPVWGAGFAWFLLGERWGATGWIGAALVLGGSLTVQMYGSLPSNKSDEKQKSRKVDHNLIVSEKPNHLSASPVIISSDKDMRRHFKK
ncbi:Drug/metabolite transporter [Corchorus capsularis]|uniref:Drug/metabolite transporter n=1 Tax=Corchorus capsularis TaxID=210143 RepID=A0A1R3GR67_COCAP|nr:Drug/metabolite transporter [Corchorus capsularis]